MKPESFFSSRFHLYVEDAGAEDGSTRRHPTGPKRLIDLDLPLMILLIGIPVLVYCILSSTP